MASGDIIRFGGSGIDGLKVTENKNEQYSVTFLADENNYKVIKSINGKGYLRKFVSNVSTSGEDFLNIKITIDGVLKIHLRTNQSVNDACFGVVEESLLSTYATSMSPGAIAVKAQGGFKPLTGAGSASYCSTYPDTTASKYSMIMSIPILFEQSLLIEMSSSRVDSKLCECSYVLI